MKMRLRNYFLLSAFVFVLVCGICFSAGTTEGQTATKLPNMIRVATSSVGSGTYAKAMIFTGVVKNATGIDVRIMPNDSQIGVALTLRAKEMDCSYYTATGMFYLAHGVDVFGASEWGPQPIRTSLLGMSGCGFAVPEKSDIKTWKDMVGKRVAISPGTPLVEDATLAFLAYGGITKNQVRQIVVSGMNGAYNSLIDGTLDGAYLPFEGSSAYTMESSPKGLRWLSMDPDDQEGWERLQVYLPMYAPFISRTGAGCSEENPVVGGGYAMGFFAYRDVSEEIMYLLTKSIYENYDEYKDVSKDLKYWDQAMLIDIEKHLFPLHTGTIRYLKEKELWTSNMDRWQQWREWQEAGRLKSWPIANAQAVEKKLKIGSPEFLEMWISYLKQNGFYSTPGKVPNDWKATN